MRNLDLKFLFNLPVLFPIQLIMATILFSNSILNAKGYTSSMKSFYDLMDDGYRHLSSCESRAPMIESCTEINETVAEFIDGVA